MTSSIQSTSSSVSCSCGGGSKDIDFGPRLYIKSKWDPDNTSQGIEKRIDKFEQVLVSIRTDILYNTHPSTNLSSQEHFLLKLLTQHPDFVTVNTDKNLGPAIIERT